ncbi:MAG: SDR family NAD(P)-dependent oxidoreductase [Alphaproteobacteria bacterium]|nr:SDR family NAD(P)-dependent oxidoreductase [Alphaproteobacteria bacterium]MDY4689234.1 SDR family NAD(P)-dependent oxidoreductase [Alphaproteobacteria bacterium]
MQKNINNVLITGASSGIGEALALAYAKNGAKNLFLSGRNAKRLQKTAAECQKLGAKAEAKIINVADKEAMKLWIEECNQKAPLNLVFANAGVSTGEETPENIYNTFNTNVMGVLNTVTPAAEIYKKRRDDSAKIIAITASIAGYHGLSACPSYSASKACVKAYGEALRNSLRAENIAVNVICPGFVRSRITDKNTCPMPFFMEADKAADIIYKGIQKNIGLIAFPWPMRFGVWLLSILPNCLSDFIYSRLPHKV